MFEPKVKSEKIHSIFFCVIFFNHYKYEWFQNSLKHRLVLTSIDESVLLTFSLKMFFFYWKQSANNQSMMMMMIMMIMDVDRRRRCFFFTFKFISLSHHHHHHWCLFVVVVMDYPINKIQQVSSMFFGSNFPPLDTHTHTNITERVTN